MDADDLLLPDGSEVAARLSGTGSGVSDDDLDVAGGDGVAGVGGGGAGGGGDGDGELSIAVGDHVIPIIGRSADPLNKDDWDEDFDLDFVGEDEDAETVERSASVVSKASGTSAGEPASALSRFAEGNDDDDDDWGMGSDEEDLGASFGGGDGDGGADVEQIKLRLAALAADDEDENDDFDGMGMDEGHGDLVAKLQNRAMPEEDPFAGMDSDDDDAVGEGGEGGGGGWGDDDSDSEGCWDDELDLDVGDQQHQQLRDFFNANDEDGDDDADGPGSIIPARFRLLKQLATSSERKVTIVMYPIPTRLWTIKTEAGVPYLQERELESWLDTLVSKRKAVFNDFENVAAWRGDEFKEFRLLPALTIDENGNVVPRDCKFVLRGCLLRMRKLYRQRRPKFRENIRVILAAVAEFLDSELYERKMHANDPDSPSNGGASDDQPAAAASCDVPTFRMVYDIIYAGALVWSQDSAQLFDHAMNVARQFFPRFATMLDLLQIQAVAHHDGSQANDSIRQLCTIYHRFAPPSGVTVPPLLENEEDDDGLLGANDSGMALLSPQSAAKNSMATFTSLLNSNIPVLLSESVCAKAAAQSEAAERVSSADGADEGLVQAGDELELAARDEEKMAQLVCVETLISLHLYLNSNSPLTTAALSTDARWDLDDDGFEWLENAWYGDVPPPTQQSELENLTWRLCGSPELRMTLLEALYKTLDATTRLKALAAYILGRYVYDQHQHQSLAVSKESTKRAETMLFECLYLLDSIQPAVPNNVPMITDLGINALVLYGDILMNNNKFRYGILAFENALHAYKFLKQVPYHQLIRKLSSLCVEHEDFKRAIKYHEQVREKSTEDGNLNMYVYIVQQMSKIHVHRGSFRRAEEAIRNALGYLNRLSAARTQAQATASPGGSRYAPRLDHLHVVGRRDAVLNNWKFSSTPTADFTTAIQTLYVVLAQLYLSGDRIINAINVLEMLRRRHDLPRSKVSLVHLLLATAYVKKRQFAKAGELLTRMEQSATVSASSAGDHRRDRTRTKSFTTGPTPAANLSLGDVVHSAEFMEIRAKNHMYSGEYELAMYWMNKALHDCPPSSLTYLARFHYRRGKVQQAMLLAEMMNTPSIDVHSEIRSGSFGSFTSDSDGEAHYSLNNDAEAPMPHLPDPTACIDSFTKAFEYFRKVDDNVRMAKALNRITDTYLHMVFVSVAVLCHPPAALMPWFRSVGLLERLEIDPDTSPDAAFQEFLAQIDGPAFHALDISSLTMHPILMIKCYVNMAELRFLQNEYDASWAYWKEAHDTFYTLFMNGNQTVLVNKATPGFSANMKTVLKRMVRLLLCFNPELVNEHLNVLDDYILYEVDLFSDLLASYEDQLEAERSDGQMHGSASVMRRDGRESWKKHLSDAFGAAGSRSHGKRNNRRLSLMSSRYHEDAEIDVLCTALAESVCFGLYEIGRACDQYSLGRYGQPQCAEHNRDTMRKMLRNLAQLRELSGTPASTSLEMPAPGRRSSVLSTTSIPEAEEAEGGPPSRRNSDVGLYNLSPAASPARARTQADTAAMSAVAQTSTSSSLWMLEPDSQRDPLWNNLVYMLPLDTIIFIYAPLTQVKTVRLSTEANPALIEALNMVNGKLGHAASASPQAAAAAVRVASTVLGNAPGLNLSSSRSRSRRDVSRRATDGDAVGSSPATRARGQSVSRGESYRLESLARSRLQRSSSLLSLKMPETDPNLPAQGPALAHQHPAHTHIIPTIEFMQELLADFRAKSEPIVDLLVVNDLCPDDETALEAIARAFNKSFASTSRSASGSSTGSEPNEADQGAQALGHAANGGSTPRAGLLRAVESSSATELARLASSRAPMAVAMHHAAALGVDPALLVNVGDDDPDSGRLSPMMLVSEHANDVRRRAREKSLIFAVTPEPNRHRRNSVGGSAASLVINAAALVAGAHSRSNSLMVSNGSNGSKPGSGSLLTPPGSFSAASSSPSTGDWSRREAAKRYLGPAPLDFTLVREMFSHLDPQNVLLLFSALFGECRIILSASSHSRIKAVANTLLRLMYPFQWQHTFIPVLPRECVGALYDTAPYIVGINSYILDAIPTPPGVVVVHLDKNFVKHSPGTFVSLPTRHKNLLQKAIVAFMSKMLLHQVAKMRVQDAGAEEPAAAAPAAGAARGREGSVSTNFAPTVVHAPKMTGKPVLKNITVRAGERSGHVAPDNAAEQRRQSRQRREQSSSSQSRGAVALQLSPPDGSASNLLGDHESEWSVVAEEFDDESSETEDLNGMPLSVELRQLRREQREALQNLADEFLSVFVNLFYKYRLFWDEHAMPPLDLDAFLDYTRQDARTFMESFARTQCFEAFVRARQFVPAAALGEFVFDASVERTLLEKHRSLLAMREEELSDGLLFARGTRSWNRRFVVLSKGELLIFKGRRSKNSKPKLSLKLSPGEYRVVTPCVEDDPQFFSFELCDSSRPAKLESLHFRATSNKQRRRWTRHLHAHVMSEELERCYHDATQFASARKLGKPSLSPPPSPSLDRTPSRSPPTDSNSPGKYDTMIVTKAAKNADSDTSSS